MTTMGYGVVIACSDDRLPWAEANLCRRTPRELFTIATYALIENLVAQDGQTLAGPALRYVCANDTFCAASAPTGFTLEVFGQEQMAEAYTFTGFPYAVNYRFDHPCPDMIAVVAWHNNQVIGMAGVSADSDQLWQVGVHVKSEYVGMGIGKALVSRATEATLEHDKVPYYATWISNLASSNTARSVGYQLAWTDVYVRGS
jgi:hypothetical protein